MQDYQTLALSYYEELSDLKRRRSLARGNFIYYKEQFFDELAQTVLGLEGYHDFNAVLEKLADLICPEGGDDDYR